jgi:hypothetical protein
MLCCCGILTRADERRVPSRHTACPERLFETTMLFGVIRTARRTATGQISAMHARNLRFRTKLAPLLI